MIRPSFNMIAGLVFIIAGLCMWLLGHWSFPV